jgi:hypothetical protein
MLALGTLIHDKVIKLHSDTLGTGNENLNITIATRVNRNFYYLTFIRIPSARLVFRSYEL